MGLNFKAWQSQFSNKEDKIKEWFPWLVLSGFTITTPYIAKRIAYKTSLMEGDVLNVIHSLYDEMQTGLLDGHTIKLDKLGTFRLAINARGNGVKTPQEVNVNQINGLRIIFTPTYTRTPMQGVTRAIFDGVQFKRWPGDPYADKDSSNDNSENTDNGGNNGGGDEFIDPSA